MIFLGAGCDERRRGEGLAAGTVRPGGDGPRAGRWPPWSGSRCPGTGCPRAGAAGLGKDSAARRAAVRGRSAAGGCGAGAAWAAAYRRSAVAFQAVPVQSGRAASARAQCARRAIISTRPSAAGRPWTPELVLSSVEPEDKERLRRRFGHVAVVGTAATAACQPAGRAPASATVIGRPGHPGLVTQQKPRYH